jgi:hypothetical protein
MNGIAAATLNAPTPPIMRRLEELHEQISMNAESLSALSRRLEVVTASAAEQPPEENKDLAHCSLEIDLHRAIVRLREQQHLLSYLHRNIQL